MIFLKDYVDFEQCSDILSEMMPSIDPCAIEQGFKRFFWADEQSGFWFYTKKECAEVIEEMMKEFCEDETNHTYLTIAGQVAKACGLELIGEAAQINYPSWISLQNERSGD